MWPQAVRSPSDTGFEALRVQRIYRFDSRCVIRMQAWAITGTLDEGSFFDDHISHILTQEQSPLPPQEQQLGHVRARWEDVGRKSAFIQAVGGTVDDRLLAQLWVAEQLAPHGYRRATWSFDHFRKTAEWDDVMAKAKRLIQDGKVKLLRNGYQNVVGQVEGDHGTYEPEIFRQDPNSRAITGSDCQCDWGEFQNQPRTRQWKQYQDRPCSHILALYWTSLATPLDEDVNPQAPGGPQGDQAGAWGQGPGTGQQMPLFQTQPQPAPQGVGPGAQSPAMPGQGQQMQIPGLIPGGAQAPAGEPTGPSPRDVLPQWQNPQQQQQQVNPASMPGAKGPTPTSPVAIPAGPGGALSSWRFADEGFTADLGDSGLSAPFTNGMVVQLLHPDRGTLVGRSEQHGAGQETDLPAGQLGEVLGTHPITGMVNVLYAGKPWDQNGPLQPWGAQAWHWPSSLKHRPDVKPPGPNVRRSR